jgi:hypothetical protein
MKENDGDSLGICLAGLKKNQGEKKVEMADIPSENRKPNRSTTKKSLKSSTAKFDIL